MKEIALIGDIHGKLPALTAVLDDIAARGVKRIYCLGDLCGRGPSGAAAIDLCKEHCELILKGNWDDAIASGHRAQGPYAKEIGKDRQAYLQGLPYTHQFSLSGKRIFLLHGRDVVDRVIYGEAADAEKEALFAAAGDYHPDMVLYADIHRQYKSDFRDGRIVANIGSVGNSFSTPTANYAILRGVEGNAAAPISVEFVSLPYDNQKAVKNAQAASDWFEFVTPYTVEVTTAKWMPYD